jgi:hypothetical protein
MATKKELTLTLQPLFVGKSFPAVWAGQFNRLPDDDEVRAKKSKIRRIMEEDLANQVANGTATSGFKLHYDWKNIPDDPRKIFLKIIATRPVPKGVGGEGEVTSPTPKSPTPPPQ